MITGAGSGIGRALALALAGEGCPLALVDIDERGLAETVAAVGRSDGRVTTHRADVSDRARMRAPPPRSSPSTAASIPSSTTPA